MKNRILAILAPALLLLTACASEPPTPPARPNLLLISLDTLRADHLGCSGDPSIHTPTLDRLARGSHQFADHQSQSNWTLPAHGTLFTSRSPTSHGLIDQDRRLAAEEETLAEALRREGYRTAAFVGGGFLNAVYGLDQGFQRYDVQDWCGRRDWEPVRGWLGAGEEPFFLFLHTFESHAPYGGYREYRAGTGDDRLRSAEEFLAAVGELDPESAPTEVYLREAMLLTFLGLAKGADRLDPELTRRDEALYAGLGRLRGLLGDLEPHLADWIESPEFPADRAAMEAAYRRRVEWIDRSLAELLTELARMELLDRTVVAVTSDHGEAFFEHDLTFAHATCGLELDDPRPTINNNFHAELLDLPMLIRPPTRVPAVRLHRRLTRGLDVMPTLLELLGAPAPTSVRGAGMLRELPGPLSSVGENQRSRRRSLVRDRYRLIHGPDHVRLYDRRTDPAETIDRSADQPEVVQAMTRELERWAAEQQPAEETRQEGLPPEVEDQLRGLGYIE